jgi:tetratricopeptide (TPR) repeat protein
VIELLLAAENALSLGLLDQAERTYRQVLAADPRNAIAAIGLARVALERGDEEGAGALARAALAIDPENATARRMIDRLDEVAHYRAAGASLAPAEPTQPPTAIAPSPAADEPAEAAGQPPPAADQAPRPPGHATPKPRPVPARRGLLRRLLRRS